jgi:hypothetical protein
MKRYFGFEFYSNERTTTGEPNKASGRLSIAGQLKVFIKKRDRDLWVLEGSITSDMQNNCRRAVTREEARQTRAGMSISDYKELLLILEGSAIMERSS